MQNERYIRQLKVPEFGKTGQDKLSKARILVIGAGALGCPTLLYLAAAGVGTIGVLDGDDVSITNLHRQVMYNTDDIGKPKAIVASQRMKAMNPNIVVNTMPVRLHRGNAIEIFTNYDLVVDCTDNFPSKFLVNDACVMLGKPCIIGGVMQFSGQFSVYNYNNGPTYRCLVEDEPDPLDAPSCAEAGVIGMIPGVIGSMQALEALKIVSGIGKTLSGRLLHFDGLTMTFTEFEINLNPKNLHIKQLPDYELSCPDSILHDREITREEFLKMLRIKKPPKVLAFADDGNPIDFKSYKLNTIPLYELPNIIGNLNSDEVVVLVCEHGIKSMSALKYLVVKHRFQNVFHVKDGIYEINNLT